MSASEVLNILESISSTDYSETDLMSSLSRLNNESPEAFVEAFLQLIADCAEVSQKISLKANYHAVLNRPGPAEPDTFLLYREVAKGEEVDAFMKTYMSGFMPFTSDLWTQHVFNLIHAMIEVNRFSVCGLYFVVRLVVNCFSIRSCMESPSVALVEFSNKLMQLYDFDLLTTDNYVDITEKMIYLFQFHWEDVLTADPGIVIHLTGLLLIDNNQLKKEILKTIGSILSTPGVARSIHQTLISELVLLKDILIAICHNEPHGVALEALQLIATHSQELMSDMDRYKIFALMAEQRSPIQQVAKTMFIEYVKSTVKDGQTESRRFLAVLDSLVGRSQLVWESFPQIVELLLDSLPPIIEIYLFIVRHNSIVSGRLAMEMIKIWMKNPVQSEETAERLMDIVAVSKEALREITLKSNWDIFRILVLNLLFLPSSTLSTAPETIREEIAKIIQDTITLNNLSKDCLSISAALFMRLSCKWKFDPLRCDWKTMGVLLEAAFINNVDVTSEIQELLPFANTSLNCANREDILDIIYVRHLIIFTLKEDYEVARASMDLLRCVEQNQLLSGNRITDPDKFSSLGKAIVNNLLKTLLHYKALSQDDIEYLHRIGLQILTYILDWTAVQPKSTIWQEWLESMLEFTQIWRAFPGMPQLFETVLMFPDTRKFVSRFLKAVAQNNGLEDGIRKKWLIQTVSGTLQRINLWASKGQCAVAAKKLLEVLVAEFNDEPENTSEIMDKIILKCLRNVKQQLENAPSSGETHRFKTFDVLMEKYSLSRIVGANRRIILTLTGEIIKLSLNEAEKETMRKIVQALH